MMNHFSIKLWRATKSGLYTMISDDQLSGRTEKLQSTSQSQTCKKRSRSLFGGSAASLIHDCFLNPAKTITSEKHAQQINEMHWKALMPPPHHMLPLQEHRFNATSGWRTKIPRGTAKKNKKLAKSQSRQQTSTTCTSNYLIIFLLFSSPLHLVKE